MCPINPPNHAQQTFASVKSSKSVTSPDTNNCLKKPPQQSPANNSGHTVNWLRGIVYPPAQCLSVSHSNELIAVKIACHIKKTLPNTPHKSSLLQSRSTNICLSKVLQICHLTRYKQLPPKASTVLLQIHTPPQSAHQSISSEG